MALPQFALDMLAACPRAGEGVHGWLFRTARQLHHHYPNKAEMAQLIAGACYGCGREVSVQEIADAITASESVA
jgi:hypothetical protein